MPDGRGGPLYGVSQVASFVSCSYCIVYTYIDVRWCGLVWYSRNETCETAISRWTVTALRVIIQVKLHLDNIVCMYKAHGHGSSSSLQHGSSNITTLREDPSAVRACVRACVREGGGRGGGARGPAIKHVEGWMNW